MKRGVGTLDIEFYPHKFRMHWLGSYVIKLVIKGGDVQLQKMNEEVLNGLVNGSQLKLYKDNHTFLQR